MHSSLSTYCMFSDIGDLPHIFQTLRKLLRTFEVPPSHIFCNIRTRPVCTGHSRSRRGETDTRKENISNKSSKTFPLLSTICCWSLSCLVRLHKSFSNTEAVSIYGIFVPTQLMFAARNRILKFNGFVPNASSASSEQLQKIH